MTHLIDPEGGDHFVAFVSWFASSSRSAEAAPHSVGRKEHVLMMSLGAGSPMWRWGVVVVNLSNVSHNNALYFD